MPDFNNKQKAYEMAQQMDQQMAEQKSMEDQDRVDNFLNIISQIESSGGKNFNHKPIESGIQSGTSAIGHYGLMPNTIKEISNRMQQEDSLPENLATYSQMQPDVMKSALEQSPDDEKAFAEYLAKKVLDQYNNNEEQAAYSWQYGHNISPQRMKEEPYENNFYVERYKKLKDKLQGR